MIVTILPFLVVFAIIVFFGFIKCISYSLLSARELKRIEANARAPINSNFSELINGIEVIRAAKKTELFKKKFLRS